jgi:LmbE family N-acetylglucosaminyl deacetylase
MKTVLAMGAHYDDCIFGVPGVLLQAVRKHYRVVTLHMIGDYTNWPPANGRAVAKMTKELSAERGVEAQFLDFASHRFDARLENQIAVAEAVARIKPDIAFALWKEDRHNDHMVASELSRIALRHAGRILDDRAYRPPRQIYYYDNGPRHTIGFEPNTFVNVTDEWDEAMLWLGKLNAWVQEVDFEEGKTIGSMATKEAIARYRGATCGVRYAEAFWTPTQRAEAIL